MAVTPVYELDIPAPHAAFFVNGEKALSVAPTIGGAAARTNYYISAWVDLEGGEYFMRVVAKDSSTWATSLTKINYRVVFYTARDSGTHEAIIHMPRGRQRIDILLAHVGIAPGPCYVAFSLWRQGKLFFASNAVGWVFDTQPIADENIPARPDERLSLPIFTLLPNWDFPIVERVSYSTEILDSESDIEQRRSLRLTFRRSFDAGFSRKSDHRSRLDSFFGGTGKNRFLVPIWHEQHRLTATLGATLVFPADTLELREFRVGMLCIVIVKDPNVYELLQIQSINLNTDTITFINPPVASWGAGARIIPLRVARLLGMTTLANVTDAVGTAQIRFEIDDGEVGWFLPSWAEVNQLFGFTPNRAIEIANIYDRTTAFVTDGSYGPVDVYDSEQRSRVTVRGALQFKGRAALLVFRKFIDMVRGRAVRFWMPTFTTDLQLVNNLSGNSIDIRAIGFTTFYRTTQRFRSILAVKLATSTAYRYIENSEELDASTERIRLTSALPSTPKGDVLRISFLMAVRFDQDSFEFQHLVDSSAAVITSFLVRSTDDDGMVLP